MRKVVGLILIVLLFMCMGCNMVFGSGHGLSNEQTEENQFCQTMNKENGSECYQYEGKNIHIDVDMKIEDVELTGGTAELIQYPDKIDRVEKKYITDDWNKTINDSYDENGNESKSYEYLLGTNIDAKKIIFVSPLFFDLVADTDATEKVRASFRLNGSDNANEHLYMENESHDFGSVSESISEAVKQMEELGIELGDIDYYNYYVLECDLLKKEEWMVDYNNEVMEIDLDWNKNDNYYKVFARQSFQGVPIYYTNSELGEGLSNSCMPIQMLLGENGICELNLEKTFRFSSGNTKIQLMDTKEIMNNLIGIYAEGIFDTQYYINRAELMYYAKKTSTNNYRLIPVWIFMVEEEIYGEKVLSNVLMFDATTGKEVTTE